MHLKELSIFLWYNHKSIMPAIPEKDYSNEHIIAGIKEGDFRIFNYIRQKSFPYVLNYIKITKGVKSDAEEVFQEALIVIFKKLKKSDLQLNCEFATYFIAVCKTIWKFNYYNRNKELLNYVEELVEENEIKELYLESKEFRIYRKHFNKLKKRQQAILKATFEEVPYRDIYVKFGYKSSNVFKNEVSRIKKRLIENITSDPDYNECEGKQNWSL